MAPLRDILALALCFAACLAARASLEAPWLPAADPIAIAWQGLVLVPVFALSLAALGAWSADPPPAPALPGWLVAGPVALVLSLAGFELLRVEPVSRSLVVGFAAVATPLLGVLHRAPPPTAAPDHPGALAKRAADVVLAGSLLVLLAPLTAALALWIRRDGGRALFVQERVGWGGRPFAMVKLRTMAVGAEREHQALAARSEIDGPAFRLADDPRVTAPGRWLRRTGLDELPQLINVLRGEMSLVGPRPPLPSEVARYTARHRQRLAVLPGITGLWQLTGRHLTDFEAWVDLDLAYIERQSLALDLALLLRTAPWLLRQLTRRGLTAPDPDP